MSSSSLVNFGVVLSGKANPSDFARHKRARYRYTEYSSSDSSDAGTFLVSNVKFRFVDAAIRNGYLEDVEIGIEMIAEELTLANDLTDTFYEDWQHITEGALDILDSYPATKSRVTSIALFKLGFLTTYEGNPSTVYISVNYESEENHWPPVVGEIQQLLNRYPYKLQVHMEHNTSSELCPLLFPLVNRPMTDTKRQIWPAKKYKNLVGLREDIGPECYIKTKYALTNYHIVRPAFKGFQLGTNDKDEARNSTQRRRRLSTQRTSDIASPFNS
ncbi:hypothetical protein B0H67DRAFT_680051 [Lasiosphaeris hirsuta]|uniref:Uncharacterized protein n=1 Tax=Lasiosphaeris hirsuta TaxID=260670 RepID=A0AA40AYS9_9PEZI|nr:hypothetical protein B0H67DRAFT_680051 [Lasiosphaeris hirsuta]